MRNRIILPERKLWTPRSRKRQRGMLRLAPSVGLWPKRSSDFIVDAADFDGANDYSTRSSALTGLGTTDTGILSVWFLGDSSSNLRIFDGRDDATPADRVRLSIDCSTSAGVTWLTWLMWGTSARMTSSEDPRPTTGTWHHLLVGWDWSAGTSENKVFLDDAGPQPLNISSNNGGTAEDHSAVSTWRVAADAFGASVKWDGGLAEFYYAPEQWLDFSTEANRRKFRTSAGKPADLGDDGSIPTGTAPKIYMHLDDGETADNFNTNRGSGGAFTLTGTLATRASSPSD